MNEASPDGGTMRNEFDEIHARRRLVKEYPISPCLAVTVVVLEFKDVSKDESMPDCAAMLVPNGKESDWMYSSEGGQWQLLASAGVMRLLLFFRACNTLHRSDIGGQIEDPSSNQDADANADGLRNIVRRAPKNSEAAKVARDAQVLQGNVTPSRGRNNVHRIPLEKDRNLEEKRLEVPKGAMAKRRNGPVPTGPNSCFADKAEGHGERERKYARVEEEPQLDGPLGGLRLPVAESPEDEDNALKLQLRPIALALAPRIKGTRHGVLDVPFVDYIDNILQRVIVEEAESPLLGLMRVEDVELETQGRESGQQALGESNANLSFSEKSWRRRLIFKRMPNLIQTEVLLHSIPTEKKTKRLDPSSKHLKKQGAAKYNFQSSRTLTRMVDHTKLVHRYLPPIVAGFVLVSPCLDALSVSGSDKAKILCIGVGGGALPIFLQRRFPCHIQVVELDKVVLRLARKHFGLEEDSKIHVTVKDGVVAVKEIATRALEACHVDESRRDSWANLQDADSPLRASSYWPENQRNASSGPPSASSGSKLRSTQGSDVDTGRRIGGTILNNSQRQIFPRCDSATCARSQPSQVDPRLDIIILDVDASDSQLELNSPPRSFLEPEFLLSVSIALQSGGMLAMNVVPTGRKAYEGVIRSLQAFFVEVYEIDLKDDLNCIVFALPSPVCVSHGLRDGYTFNRVKDLVGEELIHQIQRIDSMS